MALVGAMFFSQSVWAQDYAGSVTLDDGITIYYRFLGDRITICAPVNATWNGFNMPVGDLVIPASITHQGVSYPVTDIEPEAFENCIDITSVIIPNSVNQIAYNAFFECSGITSLTIGSSVIDISDGAFAYCTALEEIHFRSANPPTLNSTAFYELDDVPVYVPCGSLLNYSGWGGFTDIRGESEKVKIGSLWYLLDCADLTATVVPELSVPQQIASRLYSSQESCPSGNISIPASVGYGNQTFAVTAIGDGAFAYCQNISSIVIPESVTSIGNSAFAHCLDIASVVIPEGVTTIGNSAFYYCIELESVTIPNSMTGIGNGAFRNCDNLESLTIGNSVTSIGNEAFGYCLSLESVTIPNSVISIGNNAFNQCYSLTSVSIGNSVTNIGKEAFLDCNHLTSVTIPNSVTSVGNGAFRGCVGMTSLTIGNSVTSIGNEAFAGCNHLTEVHSLASNPPTLGTNVFLGLPHNTPLYVPCGTVSDYHSASVWSSFTNIQNEDDCFTVTVSANDPEMGSTEGGNGYYLYWAEPTLTATPKCGYRFVHWINVAGDEVSTDAEFTIVVTRDTSLTAVFEAADRVLIDGLWYSLDHEHSTAKVVPEKNTSPYYETDHKPTGALVIPSSVTYCNNDYTVTAIDANAFYSCSDLTGTLVIPNTVISIGMNAFYNCTGLTGPLNLPESIVSLGISAFNYCSGFNSLSLPNSITRIENGTFSRCTGFSGTLVIPSSVTRIGADAFYGCTGFSGSLVIPNFVGHIDGGAFYYCNHITSLTIGSAVTNIDDAAFRSCTGLESIVVQCATPPTLGSNVFHQCPTDIPVTVPCNSVVAYQATNGWSSFSHIQEASTCPRTVTATSADEAMGTVTGGGTYTPGATATLTATPACFHRFVRWKNTNDETVSTDASFDLTVTHDAALTAVFRATDTVLVNGLWYRLNQTNHTATVVPETKHNPYYVNTPKPTGELFIPSIVSYCGNDYTVTKIGANAFFNCVGLTGNVTIPNTVTSISEYAFFFCNGITSLTIGSAVSSIDVLAFRFCARLQSIVVHSATPPTLGANAFANCPTDIPVTVPCNSVAAYQAANRWSNFTHIQEASTCTHTVTVTVDDPSMGTVEGGGEYNSGATATLTATPNCGYRFVQWNSNGTLASADNPYSFNVTQDTTLTALFAPVATTGIQLECSTGQTLVYTLDCATATATIGWSTCAGDLTIPSTITVEGNEYTVTSIGTYAFWECAGLTSVTVPNTVVEMGDSVFYGCTSLSSVSIPNTITRIGDGVFQGCVSLITAEIPSSVTSIGNYAFKGCSNMTTSALPDGLTSIGNYAFGDCASITSVNMGSAVTSVGKHAFENCTGLTSLTISPSITRIEESTFENCSNLTSVTIPSSVTSMGIFAFSKCSGLTSVTIPNSVSTMNQSVFNSCTGLTSVSISNSLMVLDYNVFGFCTSLTSVTIPNSVTTIRGAFNGCSNLSTVTMPNSVTTIGEWTFQDCWHLTSIDLPNSLTSIGQQAFQGTGLTSVTIPNSVTTLGVAAFRSCFDLTSVTIGTSVSSIGDHAFYKCFSTPCTDGINEVTCLATQPPTLGNGVFDELSKANTLVVPCNTLSAYQATNGWNSFSHIQEASTCTHSVAVDVNDQSMGTVTGDGTYTVGTTATLTATPNCGYRFVQWNSNGTLASADNPHSFNVTQDTSLTALFAPVATTGIQQECSTGQTLIYSVDCSSRTATITGHGDNCTGTLTIPESIIVNGIEFSVTAIGEQAFKDCSGLTGTITIPSSVTTIGDGAFQGCSGFTGTLTIPSSVTSIGTWAFSSCSGFTGIVVENGNPQYDSRNNCNAIINASNTLVAGCQNTVIPNTVTTIGDGAFRGCTTLTSVTIPTSVTRIDFWAFSGCTGLTTLTIPGSVTNLGNYAFAFCGNLTEITSLAEEPPVANADVFLDSPKTIPVKVPCGKVSPYRNAAGWSDFNNIQEASTCTHIVTVTVDDPSMGTVSGDGTYTVGTTATLTATPNVGYHFVQWNDGNHDNPRSLTVTHDTTLTASFAPTTVYTSVDTSVCNNKFPFIWNGLTVTAAGSQTVTLQNHLGADSIVTLNVHLNHTSAGDTTAVACDHFTWYGHTYHQSTDTPTHLLTNAAGCDSTVTLHLTINPSHVGEFEITATADDATKGTVSGGGRFDAGQEVTLAASPNCGYQFLQWSDGSTHNPRTVTVAGNATYTAQFQQANYIFETPSGQMLNYAVDCNTQTACVTGYTGVCRGLLVIPPLIRIEGVIYVVVSIGPSAFENNTGLLRVLIPGTVDAIYQSAFRGCTNLAKVEGWYQLKGLE